MSLSERTLGDRDITRLNRVNRNLYSLKAGLSYYTGHKKLALIDEMIKDVNVVLNGDDYKPREVKH